MIYGTGGFDPTTLTPVQILELMVRIAQAAFGLIGAIALIYLVVGALQYIFAIGNAGKQTEAKGTMRAAIIGFFIVVISFTLVSTLLHYLGFDATIVTTPENVPVLPFVPGP